MKRRCAAFTLQRDEFFHLPPWLKYYGQHFDPEDLYVIDHDSSLPEVRKLLNLLEEPPPAANVSMVHNDEIYNPDWYVSVVRAKQLELLQRYEYVLYTDVDEWVIPKEGSLRDFVATADRDAYRCTGYEVIEDHMPPWRDMCKPILMRVPLQLGMGCHSSVPEVPITDDLFLYHLHRLNFEAAWRKRQLYQVLPHKYVLYQGVVNEEQYRAIFDTNATNQGPAEPWHQRLVVAYANVYGNRWEQE